MYSQVHGLPEEKEKEKKNVISHTCSDFLLQNFFFAFDPFMGFSKCHLKWKGGVQFERTTVELLFFSRSFEDTAYTFTMQK